MTVALSSPFEFESAPSSSRADTLAAHVDHAAVLLSQAKATEGKAGMAAGTASVRRSTAGTGLRVGEAVAVLPATSEVMGVTAGETALNSRASSHEKRRLDASGELTSTGPETSTSSVRTIAQCPAMARPANRGVTARRDEQPFFSIALPEKSASSVIPSAEVAAELEAGIAAIVAGVARKRSHIAFRSFASNSITSFSKA